MVNNQSIQVQNETIINNVVYLEPETFSSSPFYQSKQELVYSKSFHPKNKNLLFSPENSSCSTWVTSNTSPKQKNKKHPAPKMKKSFLTSYKDDEEEDYYDINDISFFELGGNDEE